MTCLICDRIEEIADALVGNINQTRESGHNVIFALIEIRALTEHPDLTHSSDWSKTLPRAEKVMTSYFT